MRRVARSLLIVDDNDDFRCAARALLEDEGFAVLGEAVDGESALASLATSRPDLVLLDIALPGLDGIVVASRIAELDHPPPVVLVSSRAAASYGERISSAPVRGFLLKAELSGAALTALLD